MGLKIENNKIFLTRGDTATIAVSAEGYTFQPGDIVKFCAKKDVNKSEGYLFKKEIVIEQESEFVSFKLLPEDTKEGKFMDYYYDVELTKYATQEVDTIITVNTLTLGEEVS